MTQKVIVVPEPKKLRFTGRWFRFDGFKEFPKFLKEEFNVPSGDWKITRLDRDGTGLEIRDGEVRIWGDEHICYATIIQFIMQRSNFLPEVHVDERFSFKFRGFHLDIARGGVPRLPTFKKILRLLFVLKYNYFAIYLEDLFPWKKHPSIGARRGRLTVEELKEIINYGRNLGVEVFPSLELSGHMENILSLPEYREFSEWHNPREGCLDLSNEEAREFTYNLLKEVLEFFPSVYIHVGGDETWALGRGKSLDKTGRFNGPELYERHHKRLIDLVREKGKVPILWGDMITGMYLKEGRRAWRSLIESPVWREALIANWDYSPNPKEHFEKKIRLLTDLNLKQIACPGLANWNRYYPNFKVAIKNLRNFLSAAKELKVEGFLITAWGDDGEECLFHFLDPLILASMEIAEGSGKWEEKWLALTGENKGVLEARKIFGEPEISESIKHVLFADERYHRLTSTEKQVLLSRMEEALKKTESTRLPEDLYFIRLCIAACVKRLRNDISASDLIALSSLYSKLWLSERKEQGLERIVSRFWGAAGRVDLNLG
ncbi:beta-N-acetylhexosaminidase [Candidatus Bathyarchaeota archaeon]|nr:MAG: beta-N-acetylhexosaminidase [Candidatus Bathyarchaeota archaeon]